MKFLTLARVAVVLIAAAMTHAAFGACLEEGGYPFGVSGAANSCLRFAALNSAIELSQGPTPPANGNGAGAGFGKLWLDTSTSPNTLRQCAVSRCTAGVYHTGEWNVWGTVDATNQVFEPSPFGVAEAMLGGGLDDALGPTAGGFALRGASAWGEGAFGSEFSLGGSTLHIASGGIAAAMLANGDAVANLGYTPLNPANSLSDVASAAAAQSNLRLATAGINPLIAPYSAPTNGTTDASSALSSACTAANTVGVPLLVDIVYAIKSNVTLACNLEMARGGAFVVAGGDTLTHQGQINAPRLSEIFSGSGTATTTSAYRSVAWWGAVALQALGSDPTPAIQAAFGGSCSNTRVDFDASSFVFQSRPETPNYPAVSGYGVLVRGCSSIALDFTGASVEVSNSAPSATTAFGLENDTDISVIGGNFIGNSSGAEAGAFAAFSTLRLRIRDAVFSGDWNSGDAPVFGNWNSGCALDVAEVDYANIGFDFGTLNDCDTHVHQISGTSGGIGSVAFADTWDQHFSVTTQLTASAAQGATSISLPDPSVSAVANNGSGEARLTVGSATNLVSGAHIVTGVGGTPNLNGAWYFTPVDGTHIDLAGSTFGSGYSSGNIAPHINAGDVLAIGNAKSGYQYVTVTGAPSGGTVPVTALSAAAAANTNVTDLYYNQTGAQYVEGGGNRITIDKDLGNFYAGVQLGTGGWTVDGDISNNQGGGSLGGNGVYLEYQNSGAFTTVGHPLGSVILRGRYANNGNATHGGAGILLDTASVTNGVDLLGPITLSGVQLDNNYTEGAQATADANAYAVGIGGYTCSGPNQTLCLEGYLLQLADPPPTVASDDAGVNSYAFHGTPRGHVFDLAVTVVTGTPTGGEFTLTFPSTSPAGQPITAWNCQFNASKVSTSWPAVPVFGMAVYTTGYVFSIPWTVGSALTNGGVYGVEAQCQPY